MFIFIWQVGARDLRPLLLERVAHCVHSINLYRTVTALHATALPFDWHGATTQQLRPKIPAFGVCTTSHFNRRVCHTCCLPIAHGMSATTTTRNACGMIAERGGSTTRTLKGPKNYLMECRVKSQPEDTPLPDKHTHGNTPHCKHQSHYCNACDCDHHQAVHMSCRLLLLLACPETTR